MTGDPGAADDAAKEGSLSIRIGLGWAKSHSFITGQCPVMRYHRQLMNAILNDRAQIAKAVNASVISLDERPKVTRTSTAESPRSSSSTPTGCSAASSASAHRAAPDAVAGGRPPSPSSGVAHRNA